MPPQNVMPEQVMPAQPMMPNIMPQMQPPMPMCPYMQPNMPNMAMPNMPSAVMPATANEGMMPEMANPGMLPEAVSPVSAENAGMEGPATAKPGDPPPILSNNPPTTNISLFKELTGYRNYGNPSGNADILYTGNRGSWTFTIPGAFLGLSGRRAQLIIRGVLDDHYNTPESRYSCTITINDRRVHTGRVPFVHGRPSGQMFNNWVSLPLDFTLARNNRVVIVNTSDTGTNDWIGLDWMDLRVGMR